MTRDEVPDPLKLDVSVRIDTREEWHGSTSSYVRQPEEVVEYLQGVFTPVSGTVIGMGTIPWCCGPERDSWIRPGDKIEISMESLGCLRQVVPTVYLGDRKCRWKARK